MYLIVGLGNPEPDYSKTRHNMGFDVINELAEKYEIDLSRTKYEGIYGSGIIGEEKVVLVKPQTYMNSSGKCIKPFVDFYKIPLENVLVIFDDMDIPVGEIKVRKQGSGGSHNGAKSVIHELKSELFPRIRVGIGKPIEEYNSVDYVIGEIDEETYSKLQEGVPKAITAIEEVLKNGIEVAMSRCNVHFEKGANLI